MQIWPKSARTLLGQAVGNYSVERKGMQEVVSVTDLEVVYVTAFFEGPKLARRYIGNLFNLNWKNLEPSDGMPANGNRRGCSGEEARMVSRNEVRHKHTALTPISSSGLLALRSLILAYVQAQSGWWH